MVMCEHDCRRIRRDCGFEDLSRMHQNRVECALRNLLDVNEPPPRVQQNYLEMLHLIRPILFPKHVGDALRRVQSGSLMADFRSHSARQGKSALERDGFVPTDTLYLPQIRNAGSGKLVERFEFLQ